ncbi:hypothetical protein WJX84_008078 [Apatococcus fuscideae]|uniref:DNA-directed RNA polymerase III subunit RPC9 n=1 Tax=Apatococcus fuscideae TaxID=2026836 RepID=A0AAW1SUT9_9CHLO
MQVVSSSIGLITNPEVLSLLKEREAGQTTSQPTQSSESKVVEYLEEQGTVQLPTSELRAFSEKAQTDFGLTKLEVLQLINQRPTQLVEVSLIVQHGSERLSDDQMTEILELIAQLLTKQTS